MFPSKLVRRAGIASGVATGTFLLAMAATPAYAIGTPTLTAGSACPAPSLASLIPNGLECVNGILVTITSQLPLPTPAPTSAAPQASPSPSPAPNPLTGVVSGVTGTVTSTVTGVTGTVSGLLGSGGASLPGSPGTPSSSPSAPAGSTAGTAGSPGGSSKPPATSGATASKAAAADGSGLLGPAAAFLPGTSIAGFTDLANLPPLADPIPAPLLASPDTKLAAVQAPLIAAGQRASQQADPLLTRFAGKALPGILVVLATGMVAAVGAGNLRAWQNRLAVKRGRGGAA